MAVGVPDSPFCEYHCILTVAPELDNADKDFLTAVLRLIVTGRVVLSLVTFTSADVSMLAPCAILKLRNANNKVSNFFISICVFDRRKDAS